MIFLKAVKWCSSVSTGGLWYDPASRESMWHLTQCLLGAQQKGRGFLFEIWPMSENRFTKCLSSASTASKGRRTAIFHQQLEIFHHFSPEL